MALNNETEIASIRARLKELDAERNGNRLVKAGADEAAYGDVIGAV
jgi:hypothetical protein